MRILVIRLSSIGDVILTTSVLRAFKDKYPDSTIDFLVMDKFKDAIEGDPYVDKIILFRKKSDDGLKNLLRLGKELKEKKYDYVFDLHGKFRSIFLAAATGAKRFRYKKRSHWKTILVKMKLIKYRSDDTIIKNYMGAFKKFDLEYTGENLNFAFTEKDLNKIPQEYRNLPVIAPGASKETKKWLPQEMGKLAKMIYRDTGLKTVIIGGGDDTSKAEIIKEVAGECIVDLTGKLSLKESGALLSVSRYLITNDSGPFHIGRGVNCPSFVIFGPTDPGMFDLGKNDTLIYSREKCSPCSLHGDSKCPKGHFNCMKNIKAEDVYKKIKNRGF